MKYIAYLTVWICVTITVIAAMIFTGAAWSILALLLPLGVRFPEDSRSERTEVSDNESGRI